MTWVVVIKPGEEPMMVEHAARTVGLQAMYAYTECQCVGRSVIWSSPRNGREYDVWYDDEGLLHDGAKPNRKVGDTMFCGTLMICKSDAEGESLPLDDREAEVMMRLAKQWEKLDPETTEKARAALRDHHLRQHRRFRSRAPGIA